MPINFQPATPVAPNLSAAGGQAEVMTRDFPTLGAMYAHIADLRQRQQQMYMDQARAGAQIGMQGNLENARLMQSDRQFNDSQTEQQREFQSQQSTHQAQLDTQANIASFEAQQQQVQQQQRAQLQAWVNGQEMTQKEQMQLEQQKAAVAEVNGREDLEPQEKADLITQLRTGIDVGNQRVKKAQADALNSEREAMTKKALAQTEALESQKRYQAAQAGGQVVYKTLPQAKQQIAEEVDDAYPELSSNPKARQDKIDQIAQARGQVLEYFPNGKGGLEANEAQHKMVVAAHDARIQAKMDAREEMTTEQKAKHLLAIDQAVDAWAAKKDTPPSETEKDAERAKRVERFKRDLEDMKGGGAKAKEEAKREVDKRTTNADSLVEKFRGPEGAALPPQAKQAALGAAQQAKYYLAKYGPPEKMPPEVQKSYKRATNLLEGVYSMLPKPPDVSAAKAALGAAARMMQGGGSGGPATAADDLETERMGRGTLGRRRPGEY